MKNDSDNFRESAVLDIIKKLQEKEIKILLYEPYFEGSEIDGIPVIRDLNSFIINSELIIANRFSADLEVVQDKVYSRDLFGEN